MTEFTIRAGGEIGIRSRNRNNAALHAYLYVATAKARCLMEQALQKKAIDVVGIDLKEVPAEDV